MASFVPALDGDAGLLLLGSRHAERFFPRASFQLSPSLLAELAGRVATLGPESAPRRALAQRTPLYLDPRGETATCPIAPPIVAAGYASAAVIPLDLEGAAAGVVLVFSRKSSLRVPPPEKLGTLVAPIVAVAHALRAVELARASEARGDVVARVARGVLENIELSALFPELIRLVSSLCPCDAASVATYCPDEDVFELVATYGHDAMPVAHVVRPGVFIPANETPLVLAWRGELVHVPDQRKSPYPRAREIAEAGIVSALHVPVGSPTRGVLSVGHRFAHAFSEEDIELYRSIVPFIEIALRNAELVEKMRTAYRELDATQERLVRSERMRALGEVAAGVAHDVGNVLALVASHAELLAQRARDDDMKRLLAECQRSVADGADSVRRILGAARGPDAERAHPAPRARFDRAAREALFLAAARLGAHDVSVRLEEVGEVRAFPSDARDAVLNLVLNALEALAGGGRIVVSTSMDGDQVRVAVEDSGPGVPEEHRERIFEPFFTSKGSTRAGLGLATVARFVRQSAGTVVVDRSPDLGGARFVLRFPALEPTSDVHELERRPAILPVELPPPSSSGRTVKVLLVEDETALRNALSELLRMRGHVVETAGDVAGGLAVLERCPDLEVVVTDLGLPDRSGWELVDAIRKRPRELPVIVLSGWGPLTDPTTARERGVAAVLAKPTSEAELAATIESLAGRKPSSTKV